MLAAVLAAAWAPSVVVPTGGTPWFSYRAARGSPDACTGDTSIAYLELEATPLIAYRDGDCDTGHLTVTSWNGSGWVSEYRDPLAHSGWANSFAEASNGTVFLAYTLEFTNPDGTVHEEVRLATRTDTGWGVQTVYVSDHAGPFFHVWDVGIALGPDGEPRIAVLEWDVFFGEQRGITWTFERVRVDGANEARLAFDCDGRPWLVVYDRQERLRVFRNDTGAWSGVFTWTTPPNRLAAVSALVFSPDCHPLIAFGRQFDDVGIYLFDLEESLEPERITDYVPYYVALSLDKASDPWIYHIGPVASNGSRSLSYVHRTESGWDTGAIYWSVCAGLAPSADRDAAGEQHVASRDCSGGRLWSDYIYSTTTPLEANSPPVARVTIAGGATEGSSVTFDASGSTDPEGNTLAYRWDFDDDGSWDTSWSSETTATTVYGDNALMSVRVEVSDGALSSFAETEVRVENAAPSIQVLRSLVSPVVGNLTLRVAGEKWHDVTLELAQGDVARSIVVVRSPGNPGEQSAVLEDVVLDPSLNPRVTLIYAPADDPVNGREEGGTPAWVVLRTGDGREVRLHHTFVVRQPDTWRWSTEIGSYVVQLGLRFEAIVEDAGSDDLAFTWDLGDGSSAFAEYFNDGVGRDPAGSTDGIFPFTAWDEQRHTYRSAGTFEVVLRVTDDDGGLAVGVLVVRFG